jgi:predicted porin
MKKSLLALAALGAFAGSAAAQSSVTLFGIVDLAATWVETADVEKYLLATSGNATSRLGFRGVEDLGGGLRAGFWLEGETFADDGNASAGATAAFNFRRRSTVSLMGGFGEIRLGRDYTPTFWNWTVFDPFGTNGVGSATNLGLPVAGIVPSGSYGTLVRADNTIGYHLPAGIGGLYGQVMVAAGEGNVGNKFYGGRLGWAAGPFNVAGAYGQTEVPLGDMDGENWNVGASWNLGFMTLSGFYGEITIDGNLFEQTNWYVGASVPFGAFTLKGSYGMVERDKGPFVGEADQWAVGVVYDLSKRTALYATYSAISNDDNAAYRVFGGTNAPAGTDPAAWAGKDSSGYQFGIRHSF